MAPDSGWDRYEVWNQAFCRVVFSTENAGRPVYLDMDDEILWRIAEDAGTDSSQAIDELAAAVRGTLNLLPSDRQVFGQHTWRLRLWRQKMRTNQEKADQVQPPPVLALLGVLTLAAEEMERDSDYAANAYYPRLFRLLRVDNTEQRRRLELAYRKQAETLWRGLNDWLSAADGRLGLPSAYALSHRYVGLPMSQALVRSADRHQFPRMFHRFGLPPGAETSPADMEGLLDSWIHQTPSPVSKNLQSLWRRGQARERIANVAAIELLSWDGSIDEQYDEDRKVGEVLLLCLLRRFPRPQLEISFVARLAILPCPQSLAVLSADGSPPIDVTPAVGARIQPTRASELDPGSLIQGVLRLADAESGKEVSRRPRRVVPLRHDELLNAYVECERVQLGEDMMLLVKNDHGLPDAVRGTLDLIARPGYREQTALPGLPAGWVLYTDVQIMASPMSEPGRSDLNVLVPLLSSQLTLAGGLKLPGRLRKWSSLDPPEVRAVVQDADSIAVELLPLDDGSGGSTGRPTTWTSQDPTLVIDLAAQGLPDGDYELSLLSKNKVIQQTTLRLRSSSTPDHYGWQFATQFLHDFSKDGLAALRAITATELPAGVIVRGSYASPAGAARAPAVATPDFVGWDAPKPGVASPATPIVVAVPDPTSCVVTGAHRINLPTFYGHPTSPIVSGVCESCGLVKRYPARYSAQRFAGRPGHSKHGTELRVDVSHIPEVQHRDANWDMAFDSLVHVGGGSYHLLERVAFQVEGSRLFLDDFTRSLEVRGDLEIRRGLNLTVEDWAISPAYLAELTDGAFMLTGCWTQRTRHALEEVVRAVGGELLRLTSEASPARYVVDSVEAGELEKIAKSVGSAGVVRRTAFHLLDVLPPLSELEAALPRVPMPGARRILAFHVPSASWVQVASAAKPGAYRLEAAFATTDVFRTAEDIDRGEAALGTVQLIKHIAARHSKRPFLAYLDSQHALAVPLGADLPVLYGRTAVLCSGRLPTPLRGKRLLIYHDVPQAIADGLTGLLTT